MSHHHKDSSSEFKEHSLRSIAFRRKADKWLKITLFIVAILMILLVIAVHILGL